MKIAVIVELVFDDWRKNNQSIYQTEEGVNLSLGPYHSGTTFSGIILVELGDDDELLSALNAGYIPVFEVQLPQKVQNPPDPDVSGH